jgi:hypothetical protein
MHPILKPYGLSLSTNFNVSSEFNSLIINILDAKRAPDEGRDRSFFASLKRRPLKILSRTPFERSEKQSVIILKIYKMHYRGAAISALAFHGGVAAKSR